MIPNLVLFFSLFVFWRLLKRDIAQREGLSRGIWIPTIWVAIIASRPVSAWLGFGGAQDTLEGSPMDRLFFLVQIFAALVVLQRRGVDWPALIQRNWPIFLFYGYLLVSVVWANSPVSSFKRWFKEIGNIFILLVILTEANPQQALRAVFVRCGLVLIPLSLVFVRYFPELGRRYNGHSGALEAVGVTFQKNSLGAMILVCGFVMIWDLLVLIRERAAHSRSRREFRFDLAIRLGVLLIGFYLLNMCDSKTSIVCLLLGGGILVATNAPLFRRRLRMLGAMTVILFVGLVVLDQVVGIKDQWLALLGRDATLTGRTDVWRELLAVKTDPLFGTGFMSFWDDQAYRSKLPNWVAFSAHNGYLEVYLGGGFIGVGILVLSLLGIGLQVNKALSMEGDYGVVRFAAYLITLVANISESNFACMSPVGFLFLGAAIGEVWTRSAVQTAVPSRFGSPPIDPNSPAAMVNR